ncbi:cytoplasmic protein [Desulfovibrio mangrovi]|uniref:cytoplasmic protein n=1 Tax=Desulfovibrio mangrovi TaxID=2976983 RepID=UPI002247ECB8|nr:cytoplasmic protein [Desulfovibrio mangrovi]UZP68512.1 cytoplasmic protein [Desulfovibrio mangrovi]
MRKIALFPFTGEVMCFVHVLLNALDMHEKGYGVKIVVEGAACAIIPAIADRHHFMHRLYMQAKESGLFVGACHACSVKQNVDKAIEEEGIPLIGDMHGHPSMSQYMDAGYEVVTF